MLRALFFSALVLASQAASRLMPDPPISCSDCEEWNRTLEPFRIFGNSYYVGTAGLSAILVTSPEGHIVLDGALPQSAPIINANIRALGFAITDVRLIVNSHAHFDHAGGINALQRASAAQVAASASGAAALMEGMPTPDDPQRAYRQGFPPVSNVRIVSDGELLRVGSLAVTAHLTPGHTPGSTTWTWQSCEGSRCLALVYADSLNAVSSPGFRFSGDGTQPSLAESFRDSIAKVERLPCDIVVSVHPSFTNIDAKLAARKQHPDRNPFIDPNGCRSYAADARKRLEQRLADERK